jgi:hypothetical protein|tara:strand:+ start:1041 stop:1358 length:318 start_codon:yes stop_codon:yes gene_type:complete
MISVWTLLTATVADFLSGTQLDQVPGPGTFQILGASTVGDSTISVVLAGTILIDAQPLPLRANGVPDMSNDPAILISVDGGVRPIITITEVSAMTAMIQVTFVPA